MGKRAERKTIREGDLVSETTRSNAPTPEVTLEEVMNKFYELKRTSLNLVQIIVSDRLIPGTYTMDSNQITGEKAKTYHVIHSEKFTDIERILATAKHPTHTYLNAKCTSILGIPIIRR